MHRLLVTAACGLLFLSLSPTRQSASFGGLAASGKSSSAFASGTIHVARDSTPLWVQSGQPSSALHGFGTSHQSASAFVPNDIQTAYDFTPLGDGGIDGHGQTVALIELGRPSQADLNRFDAQFGLPSLKWSQTTIAGTPARSDPETTLDIEWLHALAPGATVRVYYIPEKDTARLAWQHMATALNTATAQGTSIISISLGICSPGSGLAPTRTALTQLVQRGVTVFAASGDEGAKCGNKIRVSYPGGDPSVVSVGGTTLRLNDDGTIAGETAWKYSGGGQVSPLLRPAWQIAKQLPRDRYRWAPDVAFDGNQNTGVAFYYKGHWRQVGGTSLGAPCWAAIWALVRQDGLQAGKQVGAAEPLIYKIANSSKYRSAFHDITTGSNGKYRAHAGWDAVTGLGTPDVAVLSAAVQSFSH